MDNQYNNIDELVNELYDELADLEMKLEKIENNIDELWDNVILPYLDNNNAILNKLSPIDSIYFTRYMYDNNPEIKLLLKKIKNVMYEIKELS